MIAITRRRLLGTGAFAASGLAIPGALRAAVDSTEGRPSLKDLARRKGIKFGTAVAAPQVLEPTDFTDLVEREVALIVPENEMKWFEMSPAQGVVNYELPDRMVDFAQAEGIVFRGHCLVWYWRTPWWFQKLPTRAEAEAALIDRVRSMTLRYAGRIDTWDVVNEAVEPKDGRADGLREAVFLKVLGPGYIDLAYHHARECDPKAALVYNDYDIEYDTPEHEAKRTAVLRFLERMKHDGVPLDRFGVQGHLTVGKMPFSETKFRRFLADVAGLGLHIMVTELDVTDELAPGDIPRRDQLVADEYSRFLAVALDEKAVDTLIPWGLSDRYSWIVRHEHAKEKWRTDGLDGRPLPFDAALQPKPAWTAIAHALDGAPSRS
ncbi:MAG TPA: endo-1,4-beta-xylanase [Stellaceae bacterium]|nr:endo-1,4-beta-xylanase [Stellaceae bacterium]